MAQLASLDPSRSLGRLHWTLGWGKHLTMAVPGKDSIHQVVCRLLDLKAGFSRVSPPGTCKRLPLEAMLVNADCQLGWIKRFLQRSAVYATREGREL